MTHMKFHNCHHTNMHSLFNGRLDLEFYNILWHPLILTPSSALNIDVVESKFDLPLMHRLRYVLNILCDPFLSLAIFSDPPKVLSSREARPTLS